MDDVTTSSTAASQASASTTTTTTATTGSRSGSRSGATSSDKASSSVSTKSSKPVRTPRVRRACDACRKKKLRCDGVANMGDSCASCQQNGTLCEFSDLLSRKGHPKGHIKSLERRLAALEGVLHLLEPSEIPNSFHHHPSPSVSAKSTASPARSDSIAANAISTSIEAIADGLEDISLDSDRYIGRGSGFQLAQSIEYMSATPSPTLIGRANPSQVEVLLRRKKKQHSVVYPLPPPDLAQRLIDAYFLHHNTVPCLLHRGYFERKMLDGSLDTQPSFRSLYFMVCALGARVVRDPRLPGVTSPSYPEGAGYARGYEFYKASVGSAASTLGSASLEDLQTSVLTSIWYLGSTSPISTWACVAFTLRRAIDVGCHRERRRIWNERPMIDQLRKRAFYELVGIDRFVSTVLGRPLAIHDESFDVERPMDISDADLEQWEASGITPIGSFHPQPIGGARCLMGLYSIMGDVSSLINASGQEPREQKAVQMVSRLDSMLNEWLDTVPDHLRWDADQPNDECLLQSGAIFCWYYSCQIIIHREFIASKRAQASEFPSLAIVANAARSLANVADALRQRGLLERAFWFAPLQVSNAALILLVNVFGSATPMPLTSSAMRDVNRTVMVLDAMSDGRLKKRSSLLFHSCFMSQKCAKGVRKLCTLVIQIGSKAEKGSGGLKRSNPSDFNSESPSSHNSSAPSPVTDDGDAMPRPNTAVGATLPKKSRSDVPSRPVLPTKTSELGIPTFNGRRTFAGSTPTSASTSSSTPVYSTAAPAASIWPDTTMGFDLGTLAGFGLLAPNQAFLGSANQGSAFQALGDDGGSADISTTTGSIPMSTAAVSPSFWQNDFGSANSSAEEVESLAQAHASLLASFGGEASSWDSTFPMSWNFSSGGADPNVGMATTPSWFTQAGGNEVWPPSYT
ncbi:BQ2448_6583 [Microbotryum intermedium]|uniref:BQ2448_6583 protein n=1 Tax=Microbotryum intermedium TaxID=269621 RepID=A0A238FPM3_9BASI|nr:BQ2448_6583 [Microbotryum intermedium]